MNLEPAIRRLNGHDGGRAYHEAYLEPAQEFFLDWMREEGLIAGHQVVFKGGTSLRKFRFGHRGRFSVDLDFTISDRHYGEYVLTELGRGFTHRQVSFEVADRVDHDAMKTAWRASAGNLATTRLSSRLDFSTRGLLLPPEYPPRAEIVAVDATTLGFDPVDIPIAAILETVAEKLARYRRVIFGRLYDLFLLATEVRPHFPLVKELLFFKVWGDVVDDDRGNGPFRCGPEYTGHTVRDVRGLDDLGVLTGKPADGAAMLRTVESIFSALGGPEGEQQATLSRCHPTDRHRVEGWARAFAERYRQPQPR